MSVHAYVPFSDDEVSASLIDVATRKIPLSLADQDRLLRTLADLRTEHSDLALRHSDLTVKFKRVTTCR